MRAVVCLSNRAALFGQQQRVDRRPPQLPAAAAVPPHQEGAAPDAPSLDRRSMLAGAAALATAAACQPALAIQGLTAGRIPGITGPDDDGFYTYQRPEGKSGGHGVGWTEVERYKFKVPQGWEEVPVSIADLGGTEIDLRYLSADQGNLFVVVAPVARFRDIPFNSSLDIQALGTPDQLIAGFAPELYGGPLQEDDVLDMQVVTKGGLPYYVYELTRHRLVSAAATGNRLYILAVNAKSLQWRKHSEVLLKIRDSFEVPEKAAV
ncbi:hypothetical protein ABPG77_007674 [Micractinium sp. CCAP 211/92]